VSWPATSATFAEKPQQSQALTNPLQVCDVPYPITYCRGGELVTDGECDGADDTDRDNVTDGFREAVTVVVRDTEDVTEAVCDSVEMD
jgi:hypothetical protein